MWRGVVLSGRLRLLASAGDFTGNSAKLLGADKDGRYPSFTDTPPRCSGAKSAIDWEKHQRCPARSSAECCRSP
jgi:hypothetical protein